MCMHMHVSIGLALSLYIGTKKREGMEGHLTYLSHLKYKFKSLTHVFHNKRTHAQAA